MTDNLSVIEQLDFQGVVDIHGDSSALPALKNHYVREARRFDNGLEKGIDAVYFSGEYPSVYFKSVNAFTPAIVQEVVRTQRKIWNQGKVPFLYVESPTEIRVYNCYEKPRQGNLGTLTKDEEELRLIQASKQAEYDLQELRDVFDKVAIESGGFWQKGKYANRVVTKTRIDETLINNIKKTRLQLRSKGLPDDVIHDLLLRSLFILYLEDRNATDQSFYEQYLPGADSYFKILTDLKATYRLFQKLEITFNGNLCPIQEKEQNLVTEEHLDEIKRCFWSDWALSKQPVLLDDWRIFDFAYIPIQLISEIYEDFLSEEAGEDHIAKTGAFYTPHTLAEFVLNQVLPYPSKGDIDCNIPTIDPACGSGIFLVDTLNRLLDRWEYANFGKKLTFDIITQIVLNNIFGVEIEREAIKVAAFSIYLTMLDRLDPKTLWQNNRFPYLVYDPENPDQQQGKNLFRMSSLGNGPFAERTYALVVGNPPFTNKVSTEVMAYLTKLDFAKETAIAFLHRVIELCPTGTIALISTSKILFNNGPKYQNFRRFLFNDMCVEKVYNFSAFRRTSDSSNSRKLLTSASVPICVFVYRKGQLSASSEKVIYYTPTTNIQNRLVDGIVIDPTDEQFLPRDECQKPDSKIWKVAMWGTERDFKFIERLKSIKPLINSIQEKGWTKDSGVGFQTGNPKDKHKPELKKIPHIDSEAINRYYTQKNRTESLDIEDFSRLGKLIAYKAPHLLIKEGQADKRFCASYLDFDCSFRKTIFGIHSKDDADLLKLLAAYLNSSLAAYIMFLTTADWGIERKRVMPNELLDLPDLCFGLAPQYQQNIIKHFDAIINIKKQDGVLTSDIDWQILILENQIEKEFWDGLNLSQTERILIEDLLSYRLDAFQGRHDSDAFKFTRTEDSKDYSTHLCQIINHFLQPDDTIQARAEYFEVHRSTPLQVIILHLDEQKRTNIVEKLPADGINDILRKLEDYTYKEEAESIYFRRFLRYYKDDTIYIVKPNERRFWSRSMALSDADEIILEILTSAV